MGLLVGCGSPEPSEHPDQIEADTTQQDTASTAHGLAVDELPLDTTPLRLVPATVNLADGRTVTLDIPEGYELRVAAEGMKRFRFLAPSPDGRLFATDMHDLTDNRRGRVYIFDGWNEDSARFEKRSTYLSGLHNPNQVAFLSTATDTFLYVATTGKLLRFAYHAGDTVPRAKPTVIDTFPSYGLSYKYGGWHLTRSLAFHKGKLYVSVGSSCNACLETEDVRATLLEMDPDGGNKRIYATGLRNAVGLRWVGDELFATGMGSDHLGTGAPDDVLFHIEEGKHYGWPFHYQVGEELFADTAFLKPNMRVMSPTKAYVPLGARVGALGFELFQGFADPRLNNWFVVALHGSSIVKMGKGYAVVRVRKGHPAEPIVTGFLQGDERVARCCDVLMHDSNSFLFTDDHKGVLYLVRRKREV
ncbi:MAG: PQQ-dependent sugar dehydrogenase [Flavobacteriales bacterium]|nr:PQQ-dependent sugar dehydrogenase [Flavobacteriales bacterium]